MKLTRRELEQIIIESLSEESLLDKMKAKGKDLGAKIKSKGQDIKDKVSGALDKDDTAQSAASEEPKILDIYENGMFGDENTSATLRGNKDKLVFKNRGNSQTQFPDVTFMFSDDNKIYFRNPGEPFKLLIVNNVLGLIMDPFQATADKIGTVGGGRDALKKSLKNLENKLFDQFESMGGKKVSKDKIGGKVVGDSGGSTRTSSDLKESESLSRGSLYRRRYYGRY